jgi:hypothetical protein
MLYLAPPLLSTFSFLLSREFAREKRKKGMQSRERRKGRTNVGVQVLGTRTHTGVGTLEQTDSGEFLQSGQNDQDFYEDTYVVV